MIAEDDDDVAQEWEEDDEENELEDNWDEETDGEEDDDPDAVANQIGDDEAGDGKILNQDEIDDMLGFDEEGSKGPERGILAILNSALVSYERLPMLGVVFDRWIRLLTTTLRNFTSDNVEVSLESVQSLRFGDYLNSISLPAMISVFKAEEWDNYGLITTDSSLVYSVVDVLLGGRKGTSAMRVEGRPYTTIELNLIERMVHMVLSSLSGAFDPLSPVVLRYERLETNPRFAAISRQTNAAIIARLRVDIDDRGGVIELTFPYATLEPIREILLQMFMGEKFGRDSIWETHLSREIWQTEIEMEAILDEQFLPLRDILSWQVGSQLVCDSTPQSKIKFRSGNKELFMGKVGRKGTGLAVKLEETLMGRADLVEELTEVVVNDD